MGLAQSCPPPMPDLGSLFGTTPVDIPSLWKAPARERPATPSTRLALFGYAAKTRPEPVHTQPPPAPQPRRLKIDHYLTLLEACHTSDHITNLHASLHSDGDVPVPFSQAVVRRLLHLIAVDSTDSKTLPEHLFDPVARFLQGDLNHEIARNTHYCLCWLKDKSISTSTFHTLIDIVADKSLLGTIEHKELRAIIQDLQALLKTGVSQSDRNEALLYAYTTITGAISAVPELRANKHLCHDLLVAASSLPPSHEVIPLILKAFEWLPDHGHMVSPTIPVVGECLFVWLRKTSRNKSIQEPDVDDALPSPLSPLMAFLDALPEDRAADIIVFATSRFISLIEDTSSMDAGARSRILYWLYLLRRCNHLRSQSHTTDTWKQLYPLLARAFTLPELAAHFASLVPADAARLVLRHWISPDILAKPGLEYGGSRKAGSDTDHFSNHGVSYTVSRAASGEGSPTQPKSIMRATRSRTTASHSSGAKQELQSIESTVQAIQSAFEARLANYICEHEAVTAPLADLLCTLREHQLDYTHHLDQVLQLMIQYHTPQAIFTFFMKLVRNPDGNVFVHPGISLTLIHFFIESGNHKYAYSVFKFSPEVWPSLCPELIFALIDTQAITTTTLFKMLSRPEFGNSLPSNLRTQPNNTLSLERINLVQHMAYALANSPHLSPLQAYRRVRDCLRYLEDRKAPLSSLMSRALVTAGVARYLQAGTWVSTMRFTWILSYVRRLEGDDVADVLDQMTFNWRNDNISRRVNRQFVSRELEIAKRESDRKAWEYRRQLGHDSKRWKRRQRLWKPWLADGKKRPTQEEGSGADCIIPASSELHIWKPWEDDNMKELDEKE